MLSEKAKLEEVIDLSSDTLEVLLKSLLKGEFSSLTLEYKDKTAPNYKKLAKAAEDDPKMYMYDMNWVSEEERVKAFGTDEYWELQWYPRTPTTFHNISAHSIKALMNYLFVKEKYQK